MEDPQKWWSGNANVLWDTARYFLGDSSSRSRKFLMLLGVFTKRGWPLWPLLAFATIPVPRYLATKRSILILSGTLSLLKSLLHCLCVRTADIVAKYAGPSPAGGQWCPPPPPFEIGTPPFHVWPTGCCIHPILYFKNVPPFWFLAPPSGFWLPLLLNPGDEPESTPPQLYLSAAA